MDTVDEELLQNAAFSAERAARVTGLTEDQLARWDAEGFFRADPLGSWPRIPGSPRLYSFRQLVELRVLAQLRNEHRIPRQQLKRLKVWIDRAGKNWATLRFWVAGAPGERKRLIFEDPETGVPISASPFGQAVMSFEMALVADDTRAKVVALTRRDPKDIGQIEKRTSIQSGRPVIKGTRLLVSTIVAHREAGATVREIVEQFPGVTPRDVRAALAYAKDRAA